LDESVLVKEEISPATNESEDKSWDNQEEEDSEPSENRLVNQPEIFIIILLGPQFCCISDLVKLP